MCIPAIKNITIKIQVPSDDFKWQDESKVSKLIVLLKSFPLFEIAIFALVADVILSGGCSYGIWIRIILSLILLMLDWFIEILLLVNLLEILSFWKNRISFYSFLLRALAHYTDFDENS